MGKLTLGSVDDLLVARIRQLKTSDIARDVFIDMFAHASRAIYAQGLPLFKRMCCGM